MFNAMANYKPKCNFRNVRVLLLSPFNCCIFFCFYFLEFRHLIKCDVRLCVNVSGANSQMFINFELKQACNNLIAIFERWVEHVILRWELRCC